MEHPGADRRALAAVGNGDDVEHGRIGREPRLVGLGTGPDEVGRAVGRAVVDHEDLDPIGQVAGARRPITSGLAAPAEVAEQLVECRPDSLRLVVCGQDDGEAGRGHASESTDNGRRLVALPAGSVRAAPTRIGATRQTPKTTG